MSQQHLYFGSNIADSTMIKVSGYSTLMKLLAQVNIFYVFRFHFCLLFMYVSYCLKYLLN